MCISFGPNQVGGQDSGKFITKPFKFWKKMSKKDNTYARKDENLTAMTKMEEFLARYGKPSQGVDTLVDNEAKQIIETNQKVIKSRLKVVILTGKWSQSFHPITCGSHDLRQMFVY